MVLSRSVSAHCTLFGFFETHLHQCEADSAHSGYEQLDRVMGWASGARLGHMEEVGMQST